MTEDGHAASGAEPAWVGRALEGVVEPMVELRRDIHAHPELAWQEVRTSALVADVLERAGLAPSILTAGTGVVCDVVGKPGGPQVALRADMDALPIDDEKSVPYRSTAPGVAHACGHDVHTAVVLGAGLGLARLAAAGELPGRVRLVFQPAEEVLPGGALSVLESGALEGVSRAFALHCDPRVDAGSVAVRAGPITGATDSVTVRLTGPGGHTARPQLTVDLVSALADVLARTPALLSRRVDPRAGLSLVWGRVVAGSTTNVIPEHGEASGTVRTLDPTAWEAAADLVPELIREIAMPYRARLQCTRRNSPWAARTLPGSSHEFPACWAGSVCATPGRSRRPISTAGTSTSTRRRSPAASASCWLRPWVRWGPRHRPTRRHAGNRSRARPVTGTPA